MKVLIIDNYDSFTYNLYQCAGELLEVKKQSFIIDVVRNDAISYKIIEKLQYDRIILSPGPGDPSDRKYFGVCRDILLKSHTPVLGVCLGMQGMAYCLGGKVIQAKTPMHGKTSIIIHDGKGVFYNVPQQIEVMRYHSLIVEKHTIPSNLIISAIVKGTGEIMGLRHRERSIEGIQFHPESFGTEGGNIILANFLLGGRYDK
jgi:anthranilate synthase component 2